MNVKTSRQSLADVEAEILAIGVFDGDEDSPAALTGTPLGTTIGQLLAAKDLAGTVGEVVPLLGLPGEGLKAKTVVAIGLGKRDKFDAGTAYLAGVATAKKLGTRARGSFALALPDAGDPAAIASALVEGLTVGGRGTGLRKAETSRHAFSDLTIVVGTSADPAVEAAVARGAIVGEAVNLARDLANTPPAEKTPTVLAERARKEAEAAGLKVTIWDEAKIRAERFGGLLGVAAGSEEAPAFVILEHKGGGDSPTLALVGKGVTFDSGGLSLKPSASMEDMKADMTGAAVVLATLKAASLLKLNANLVGYLILTENMVNGKAMRLGDVLTMRNGKTVEVMNTDAEGRLILADALSYAAEQQPARILDLATLTGACMVALGTKVAGLFSNDQSFAEDVLAASKRTGERAWRLPLDEDYLDQIKSPVADLKNVGSKWGGSITAAKFLEQFVADRPWVHLDIAGPSWADSESGTRDVGGTGCFVRTLIALIEGDPASV